jgi:hypothetical protein
VKDLARTLFEQRSIRRGDELLTHASDLWTCLHAVARRRRGEQPEPFDAATLVKFQAGHDYEHGVARTLREIGHTVEESIDIPGFGLESIHPDLLVNDNLVIETKTTDARTPKEVCQPHHAFQVATSALAIAAARGLETLKAVVLVRHASHTEVAYDVPTEPWKALIEARAPMVVEYTNPERHLPEPFPLSEVALPSDLAHYDPPKKGHEGGMILPYDECSYCRWRQCVRNPRHTAVA